jgi:hypothetical protein
MVLARGSVANPEYTDSPAEGQRWSCCSIPVDGSADAGPPAPSLAKRNGADIFD